MLNFLNVRYCLFRYSAWICNAEYDQRTHNFGGSGLILEYLLEGRPDRS